MRIQVLKTTPFDEAGTILSLADFRRKYGYICTSNVSDYELCAYLLIDQSFVEWFGFVYNVVDDLPEQIILEGTLFKKGDDDMYGAYTPGSNFVDILPLFKESPINILHKLKQCSFQKYVLYCTNIYNHKL